MDMKSSLLDKLIKKVDEISSDQRAFKYLTWVLAFFGLFLLAAILVPEAVSVVLNIVWVALLTIVIIFFFLGTLVIIGMRKEATRILDILVEGSLTLVDFVNFIKKLWKRFLKILKEFILYATPVLAYLFNLIIYILLIILYKYVGGSYDVTLLTILLTTLLVTAVSFLNKPGIQIIDKDSWKSMFKNKFKNSFADGAELSLFLFFLTMDSTSLFFLPSNLNVPLKAVIGDYDLMLRGFKYDYYFKITLTLIIFAIISELMRSILRIVFTAKMYFTKSAKRGATHEPVQHWTVKIKDSIRRSFAESKDDFIKFITFTTVLFAVFILFPRLKLLTLGVASITSLVLDFVIPGRLTPTPRNDLISRVLTKVFKL